jgi:RNA polymerase sigma-70 factor, ECF subfamily
MDTTTNTAETVKQFYNYLKGFIMKRVHDPFLAEDLTQEVMYRFTKAEDGNYTIKNVKAWLIQTTRHVIADHYRNPSNTLKMNLSENLTECSSQGEEHSVPDDFIRLTNESTGIPPADFILPIIKLLPEKYSKPLILSDIENIPQKEIATILGLGLSATKMRIKRARKKVFEIFVESCEIEFDSRGGFLGCKIKDQSAPLWEIRRELSRKGDRNKEP